MDKDKIEQFQQIPILGQADPDHKWNQWKPDMKPVPGSVTSDVEFMSFTLSKRLEWIEFFQKKRLELYEREPLMKEINLDLLDKKSNIAQHKLKELIEARQGLEQWQKYGDDFWQVSPPYSVRSIQQDCVKQLIEINKNLSRPTSPDYLFLTAKNRENYLRINKEWSITFDGLYQDQVNKSYFPETKYE